MKKCKICKAEFSPFNSMQKVCGTACAVAMGKSEFAKKSKKVTQAKKKAFYDSDLRHQIKLTQKVINEYVRLRDSEEPCISCGRHHEGQYHAGHYKTTAARPDIRFNLWNIHKQCSVCNNHRSGNIDEYAPRIKEKIGQARYEYLLLERRVSYSCEYLIRMRKIFSRKIKTKKATQCKT